MLERLFFEEHVGLFPLMETTDNLLTAVCAFKFLAKFCSHEKSSNAENALKVLALAEPFQLRSLERVIRQSSCQSEVIHLIRQYVQRRVGENPFEDTLHEVFADPEVIGIVQR